MCHVATPPTFFGTIPPMTGIAKEIIRKIAVLVLTGFLVLYAVFVLSAFWSAPSPYIPGEDRIEIDGDPCDYRRC